MKLRLHIGTEKTGSSYLQKLCALNRDFLKTNGLLFPHAGKHEARLQTGTISPGNGKPLAELIGAERWPAVTQWLATRADVARKQGCDSLLISNEVIFEALAGRGRIAQLISSVEAAGFVQVDALLVIRDPVDQALSLYKHRAKAGRAGSLQDWITTGYTLPSTLQQFINEADSAQLQLRYCKYGSASDVLSNAFFKDWLGIDSVPRELPSPVNPSLTLSELRYIYHVSKIEAQTVPILYNALMNVPKNRKARDDEQEEWSRAYIESHLQADARLWKELSKKLPVGVAMDLPGPHDIADTRSFSSNFSDDQLRAIMRSHYAARRWRYRLASAFRRFVRAPISGLQSLIWSRQR